MSPSEPSSLLDSLPRVLESPWLQAHESLILEPYTYTITSNPGNGIRVLLIDALNIWFGVPREQLNVILHADQLLHNASLIVDDIEDDGQLRGGQPAAHMVYGISQAINSANYAYFLAYKKLAELSRLGGSAAKDWDLEVIDELLNLHRGQGLEILWRDSLRCPTEEEYIAMVSNKTGAYFRMIVRLMKAHATKNLDIDLIPLVNIFGVYYQIRDDYMNLQSTQYSEDKGFAEDLTEGKFSFPIIHGVRADGGNHFVTSVLRKRPSTPTLKRLVVEYLRTKTRSFDYTLTVMGSMERQVREKLASLDENPLLEKVLDALHVENDSTSAANGFGGGEVTVNGHNLKA